MVGKVVDRRAEGDAKLLYIGKPEKGEHRDFLVPDGMTNQVHSIMAKGVPVGDIVIGPDGFVEAMFFLPNGGIAKLKRGAGDDSAYLGIWGGK